MNSYNPNVWFSPRFAIYYFWTILKNEGEKAKGANKYQKEREGWIVGVALLGIIKLAGDIWWLQIPTDDPPDIRAMKVTLNTKKDWNVLNHREVEVMEVTKYSQSNLIEAIKRKLRNKAYIKETGLIVYLRVDMKIEDMQELSRELISADLKIADIWLIGNTNKENNEFILFSLLPEVIRVDYNIDEEISKLPPGETIEMTSGKGTNAQLVKAVLTKYNPNS